MAFLKALMTYLGYVSLKKILYKSLQFSQCFLSLACLLHIGSEWVNVWSVKVNQI